MQSWLQASSLGPVLEHSAIRARPFTEGRLNEQIAGAAWCLRCSSWLHVLTIPIDLHDDRVWLLVAGGLAEMQPGSAGQAAQHV